MAKTRPNIIYKNYLRRAETLKNSKNTNDTRVMTRKYHLEAQVYESYAEGLISKGQCDYIFDVLEGREEIGT